ncbi:hypothetical protein CLOM_g1032 [Closterium sp. NIES-68]|nr:hypothetical protein CLOM_g1032 [Closterium sp. NIES-68]GJP71652.1 hypothetical protein CLOP_g2465 [Closterium sp. NIES-67]
MSFRKSASGRKPAGTFEILDGKKILELVQDDAASTAHLTAAFDELDTDGSGTLSRAELRPAFLRMARLAGLPEAGSRAEVDRVVDAVFGLRAGDDDERGVLRKDEFVAAAKAVLSDVAAALAAEPLLVQVFNGAALRHMAGSAEQRAAVAEAAFKQMDADGSGKLSKKELLPVLAALGIDGMPPPQVADAMLSALLEEYAGGADEMAREQFEELFAQLVAAMADALEAQPAVVVEAAVVLNGGALRQILASRDLFEQEASELFADWDATNAGHLSRADVISGLRRLGLAWGLPPQQVGEMEGLFADLFAAADMDASGSVDRAEFSALLFALLSSIAQQLERNPIALAVAVLDDLPVGGEVLDGRKLQELMADEQQLDAFLAARFDVLDANSDGRLSRAELRPAFLKVAELLGLPAPGSEEQVDAFVAGMFESVVSRDPNDTVDCTTFVVLAKQVLATIARTLKEDPLVLFSLDGARLRQLLAAEAEAEFEGMAGEVFAAIDADGNGVLSFSELRPALQAMGLAMGLPPAGLRENADTVVADVVAEYGQGKRELSRADFSALLRDMLGDVAARLEQHPVVVGHTATVLNGSRLRKLLQSPEQLEAVVDRLFRDWDVQQRAKLSCADLTVGLAGLGASLGLPPPAARDAEGFYRELFVAADMDESGFVDRAELRDMLTALFQKLALELEQKPVLLECTLVHT